jgi:PTS system nitrogen regulatory IIA component
MPLTDILTPQAILPSVKAGSKKQLLQELAAFAASQSGLSESDVYEALLQRERLGSTGIGHGIAIPHGKLPKLNQLFGIFARLEKSLDFEALDGEPVDLIFLLLAPEEAGADHLKALSRVARALRDPAIAQKLRKSHDASALFAMLTQTPTATAA